MRTKYSVYNLLGALLGQTLGIIAQFVSRRFFIIFLNKTYLGVSGLFGNMLSVLSLIEMGAGVAMTYSLYKPIANNQKELIKSLMSFYHKIYVLIGVAILSLGFALTPIYPLFIKGDYDIPNLTLIYFIFVINTAITYFFSYKRTLIICDQKRYIYSLTHYGMYAVGSALQVVVLWLSQSYIAYLLCLTVATLLENGTITYIANRRYPYLKDKNVEPLPKGEIVKLKQNIGAMLMHKFGGMIVSSTDNIVISSCIGLTVVGLYSNYLLIIDALSKVSIQFFQAITASIGNLLVENDVQHVNKVFYRVFFLGSFIYGISTIGMMCGFQSFIVWYAGNDYLLNYATVVLICISYYITGIRKTVLTFRDASANYYYDRYKAVAEAGANLILSIFFAKHLGINGVILGTIISVVFISLWVEPFVLYKYVLKTGLSKYFRKMLAYSVCTCLAGFLSMNFCKNYAFESLFLKMAVNILTGALVFVVVYIVCFWKTDEMQYVKNLGLKFLQNNKK